MIDCMNDEQDSSEDEKILFFGGFCFHYLATAAATAASATAASIFDFSLTVWQFGSLRSFERIQGRRRAADIERAWVFVIIIVVIIVIFTVIIVLFFCC